MQMITSNRRSDGVVVTTAVLDSIKIGHKIWSYVMISILINEENYVEKLIKVQYFMQK